MSQKLLYALSRLERDYYDGVGFDRLCTQVETIVDELELASPGDPVRRLVDTHAAALWDVDCDRALSKAVVRSALIGDMGGSYLRAWASFATVVATARDVA